MSNHAMSLKVATAIAAALITVAITNVPASAFPNSVTVRPQTQPTPPRTTQQIPFATPSYNPRPPQAPVFGGGSRAPRIGR